MDAFGHIKFRVAAIIHRDNEILLIHRHKNGLDSYTLPGGNVENGEDLKIALARELLEELGLVVADLINKPHLIAVQDQMVSRPGNTPPPRKMHLIFAVDLSRSAMSVPLVEHDDLGEGQVVWVTIEQAAAYHVYPAIGGYLTHLCCGKTGGAILLPAMTDKNFMWI